jgi:squalene-hopene/tetraprenyl-beta-curcumene cyclase
MNRSSLLMLSVLSLLAFLLLPPASVRADLDPAVRARGERVAQRAAEFLRSQQDPATGGWSVPPKDRPQPHLPAISSLVLTGLLDQPNADRTLATDPTLRRGVEYVLGFRKPDGGIYDAILPSYNTAITLSALARVNTPEAKAALTPGAEFLKRSQWGAPEPVGIGGAGGKESPKPIDSSNPNFGGLGYGNRGRPDLSNLAFALEAWKDAGLSADDPAFTRAVTFLQRIQMLERLPDGTVVNDQPYAKGSRQGGFIYATGENDQTIGQGNSWAGQIEETLSDGTVASRLRAYGSVTYSGFKSYLYAGLTRDDPRVRAAYDWARAHFTLAENPGLGSDGYYYYLIMFARAMAAMQQPIVDVTQPATLRTTLVATGLPTGPDGRIDAAALKAAVLPHAKLNAVVQLGSAGGASGGSGAALLYFASDEEFAKARAARIELAGSPVTLSDRLPGDSAGPRDWREELIETLERLQGPDGAFTSVDDRWMENNPVLITAYGLIALRSALGMGGVGGAVQP